LIVDELTIRQIRSGKVRRRTVQLPVTRGRLPDGSTYQHRCPMKKGGVYRLVPCGRFEHKRRQAIAATSSREEAVLLFIDLVDGSVRTDKQLEVVVTVTEEPYSIHLGNTQDAPATWVVPIALGDLSGQIDRDVFLAGDGGYTLSASRQAVPGDPAVMYPAQKDIEKARVAAREQRAAPVLAKTQALYARAETLKDAMGTMKAENRRQLILKETRRLEAELQE
jgi:hypothetical protein